MTRASMSGRGVHFSLRFTANAAEVLDRLAMGASADGRAVSRAEVLRRALAHYERCRLR